MVENKKMRPPNEFQILTISNVFQLALSSQNNKKTQTPPVTFLAQTFLVTS